MTDRGASRMERLAGLALSLPLVIVPGSAIAMMVWARWAFYQRHPDYVQHSAPTISRAISDPFIGAPFAATILAVSIVIGLALIALANGFRLAIAHVHAEDADLRRRNNTFVNIMLACQVVGSSGMVMCTQYTFYNNHDLHMIGSYLFFIGQILAIGMNGVLCARLTRADTGGDWPLLAVSRSASALRVRVSKAVVVIALGYFFLFAIKKFDLPVSEYSIYYVYTLQEIVTISAFICYLMTYSLDMHSIARDFVRLRLARVRAA